MLYGAGFNAHMQDLEEDMPDIVLEDVEPGTVYIHNPDNVYLHHLLH